MLAAMLIKSVDERISIASLIAEYTRLAVFNYRGPPANRLRGYTLIKS
jgi:hypothetical protein